MKLLLCLAATLFAAVALEGDPEPVRPIDTFFIRERLPEDRLRRIRVIQVFHDRAGMLASVGDETVFIENPPAGVYAGDVIIRYTLRTVDHELVDTAGAPQTIKGGRLWYPRTTLTPEEAASYRIAVADFEVRHKAWEQSQAIAAMDHSKAVSRATAELRARSARELAEIEAKDGAK